MPVIESARGIFDGGYGPLSPRVEDLLDRAFALTEPEVEHLAAASGRTCHGVLYAEALLAASQAAERSGRSVAAGRAAGRAEMLVVQAADARRWLDIDDRARWAIVAQQASWGAADAARALAVCDLLSEAHLRVLTHAWDDLQLAQGS